MPRVKSEIIIKARLERVWELAQDVEKLPDFMPDLTSVKVLEQQQTSPVIMRTVTEWQARIKQFNRNIHWVEEDIWNVEDHVCHFWQIRGDYSEYRGEWRFTPHENANESTRAYLEIEYRIDIPLLGALMHKVVQKLMQENCDMMLRCLQEEAERRG